MNTSQAVLNPLFPAVNTDINGLIGFGLLAILILVATQGRLGYPTPQCASQFRASHARA